VVNAQQDGNIRRLGKLAACLIPLLGTGAAMAADVSTNTDPETVFREAMKERGAGELFNAAENFTSILTNNPKLHRARLELAVTYYRLLDYDEAKKQAQVVLDDPKTPPNVRLAILAFLAQVKKDAEQAKEGSEWRPNISIGMMHDTNVNVGPSSDIVNIGGLPFQLADGSTAKTDTAMVLSAGIAHTYQTGKRVRIGQRNAMFLWQSNASVYRRDYRSMDAYDLDVISVGTGPALIVPRHLRLNLNFQGDYLRLNNQKLALFKSISPTVTFNYPTGEFTLDGTYSWRTYDRTVDKSRDSKYLMYGGYWGQYLLHGRIATQLGYQWFHEKASVETVGASATPAGNRPYSNDGTNLFAGVNIATWTNGSVYGKWNRMNIQYKGITQPEGLYRDEQQDSWTLGVKHRLKTNNSLLNNAVIEASLTKTDNKSNVDRYTYKRDQTMVSISKSFN